jgi:2-hydroxychromene-2-carboxylate isomerase
VDAPSAAFYFDLQSPLAYLASEQVLHALPGPCEWQPVLAAELGAPQPYEALRCEQELESFREDVARGARRLGLQPLRWPQPFPADSALAMRAATYAKSIGRAVPFAQAAFRQAFAGGRDLSQLDNVLIAAAACEMHPAAVKSGAELGSVAQALAEATNAAAALGVGELPAIAIEGELFAGVRAVEQATERMASGVAP